MTINAGFEGFIWFMGIVEDIDDPLQVGRVKVRIYGVHNQNTTIQPTSDLPWATPILPPIYPNFGAVGRSPTGLVIGSTVVGFFADTGEMQKPLIFGVIAGFTNKVNDLPTEALGTASTTSSPIGPEPETQFNAVYPSNQVIKTSSGHIIEIDDTTDAERINIYHSKGSYITLNPDGGIILHGNTNYIVCTGNSNIYSGKTLNINAKNIIANASTITLTGDSSIKGDVSIDGDLTVTGDGSIGGDLDISGKTTSTGVVSAPNI